MGLVAVPMKENTLKVSFKKCTTIFWLEMKETHFQKNGTILGGSGEFVYTSSLYWRYENELYRSFPSHCREV